MFSHLLLQGAVDDSVAVQQLIKSLPDANAFKLRKLNAQEFEKDVDSNHHIDFIAAASNLRARNYEITNVTRHQVKFFCFCILFLNFVCCDI
jgi:ubiquitin-activating enzyme E1